MRRYRRLAVLTSAILALSLASAAGCGGSDDGADVRTIGDTAGSGSASGSASGTASASGSGTGSPSGSATGSATGEAAPLGGYEPVSDVDEHAKVTLDVCEINAALEAEPVDYETIGALYEQGKNSLSGDGSARTLKGFATEERDEPTWDAYTAFFGDEAWLDSFVQAAIDGTGPFEGESDAVRSQGVQKGIQNGILIAWMFHELDEALADVEAGELDPAEGAPHKVDEAWAFYHGAEPDCAPFRTADRRGEDFGTGSAVNDAMLAAVQAAQAAAVDGDVEGLRTATSEITRRVTITYLQAALKYAAGIDAALEAGDEEEARVQQAEGLAFFRVVAPLVAATDEEAARAVLERFDLAREPQAGAGAAVEEALSGVYEPLGIDPRELGELS